MIAIKINTVGIPRVFQEGSFHPKTGGPRDDARAFRRSRVYRVRRRLGSAISGDFRQFVYNIWGRAVQISVWGPGIVK